MGGAIENGNQATIRNTNFTNNTANEIAGAIDNQGLLNMSNCTLQYNNAKDCAGAIMDNNRAYVTNCTLEYNKAKYGGAIYTNKTLNLAGSNFTQNNATRQGGAIYLGSTNTINVNNSRFTDNDAGNGSGIYGVSGSMARINNSLFVNNTRPTLSVSNALTNTTIIERKIPTRITVNTDETVRLGDTINIHGYLEDISNESYLSGMDILISINDEQSHAATDENGYYELSYLTESIGTNIITVIYEGNDEYDAADCQTSVEVTKAEKIETHMSITVDNNDGTIIKAYLTDNDGNNVTGGKVAFKVNGKTLKNANGKVIYANVAEGIASVEWTVPEECYDKDVTISASYSGTGTYNQTKANITTSVATRQASISIDMPDTAQTGSTITITATITDGDRTVNTGKVIFKINGKTLKDAYGKALYANVVNGVASTVYTIPA
ncbi:MAG: hypothetical protein J6S29_01570, partial [Methanosphaera sp.]|nr:hypothetical protein [Methanosphaera sp.]